MISNRLNTTTTKKLRQHLQSPILKIVPPIFDIFQKKVSLKILLEFLKGPIPTILPCPNFGIEWLLKYDCHQLLHSVPNPQWFWPLLGFGHRRGQKG